MPTRHLWEKCVLKKKTSVHRSPCRCKAKSSNQCGTGSKHSVLSISAGEVKVKEYQNHSEHWGRGEYHLSALYYKIKIEVYKECEIIIT